MTILTGHKVNKVIFQDNTAVGIELLDNGKRGGKIIINCKKDIIISCGAIESPKLLQLSGIGDETLLNELKIPVVYANSQVGQNLKDHILLPIYIKSKDNKDHGTIPTDLEHNVPKVLTELIKWKTGFSSLLDHPGLEAMLFTKTSEQLEIPDVHIVYYNTLIDFKT